MKSMTEVLSLYKEGRRACLLYIINIYIFSVDLEVRAKDMDAWGNAIPRQRDEKVPRACCLGHGQTGRTGGRAAGADSRAKRER